MHGGSGMIDCTQGGREISDVSKTRCNLGKCSLICLDRKSPSQSVGKALLPAEAWRWCSEAESAPSSGRASWWLACAHVLLCYASHSSWRRARASAVPSASAWWPACPLTSSSGREGWLPIIALHKDKVTVSSTLLLWGQYPAKDKGVDPHPGLKVRDIPGNCVWISDL